MTLTSHFWINPEYSCCPLHTTVINTCFPLMPLGPGESPPFYSWSLHVSKEKNVSIEHVDSVVKKKWGCWVVWVDFVHYERRHEFSCTALFSRQASWKRFYHRHAMMAVREKKSCNRYSITMMQILVWIICTVISKDHWMKHTPKEGWRTYLLKI